MLCKGAADATIPPCQAPSRDHHLQLGRTTVGVHDIMITEPHPCRRGFFRRLYARVQTSNNGSYWVWRQIDENGLPLTDAERAFDSEDQALSDAVRQLNGVAVAV